MIAKRISLVVLTFMLVCLDLCHGKLYPEHVKNYDRLSRGLLEGMSDGKTVANQPQGGICYRDPNTSPLVFFTDPSGNCFSFFKFRNMFPAKDSFRISSLGDWGSNNDQYKLPFDISSLDGVQFYICDTDNNRIARATFNHQDFEATAQSPIATSIGLNAPCGLGLYEEIGGIKLYVADTKNHRIIKLSESGLYENAYGNYGSGVGQFNTPFDVVRNDHFVYIADTYNDRIVALYEHANNTYEWWATYTLPQLYSLVTSIDCDHNGNIYFVDKTHCHVIKLSEGLDELLWVEGTCGSAINQYLSPRSISVSKTCNDVLLVESYTYNTGFRFLGNFIDIYDFTVFPENFDATIPSEKTQIAFKIDDVAEVTVEVLYDNEHIYWLIGPDPLTLPAGTHSESFLIWEGLDDQSDLCLPGSYTINITAEDAYGNDDVATSTVQIEGTRVEGYLTVAQNWSMDNEPYVLTDDVYLTVNCKLEIDPGVKVMPTGDFMISTYNGYGTSNNLIARGNVLNPIRFTPYRKLYPDPGSVPKGFWKGIRFHNTQTGDSLVLEHCIIEAAGSDTGAIVVYNTPAVVFINSSQISKSGSYGYWESFKRAWGQRPTFISNSVFQDNDSIPVRVGFSSIGNVSGNTFTDNGYEAFEVLPAELEESAIIRNQEVPYWFRKRSGFNSNFTVLRHPSGSCPILTIESGVQMLFDDSTTLQIGHTNYLGKIIALGSESDSIKFSALDTLKGWRGLAVYAADPTDTSILQYCEISHGGQEKSGDYGNGNIRFYNIGVPFVLEHSRISKSLGFGISYGSGVGLSHYPKIANNIFVANDSFPLVIPANGLRELKNNEFLNNKNNEVYVKGERINQSLVWQNQGVPYIVDGALMVDGYADTVVTLEIESGNVIKFKQNCELKIWTNDRLEAHGTKFTCADSLPWRQIQFIGADASIIDSCIIEHTWSTNDYTGTIDITQSTVAITNSQILNNRTGIVIYYGSDVEITDNQISLNEIGVWVRNAPQTILVQNNDFSGNKCAFISACEGGYPYTQAGSNWWGDLSGPWDPVSGDPLYNPGGKGDSIGAHVYYEPWLTEPVHGQGVTLNQPNGDEILHCSTNYNIQWIRYVTPIVQELYYTTDFPEGGTPREDVLWKFIDTVDVSQTNHLWKVPYTPSNRCRIAIKLYYENTDKSHKSITSPQRHGLLEKYEELSTNLVTVDISDANFTILVTTDDAKATAYNNGRKILSSPRGDKVHFVYTNEGWLVPPGIFYCYSSDSGRTFSLPEQIDTAGVGPVKYPALALAPWAYPCASWISGSELYYSYWGASWIPGGSLPVENLSPPSMVVDNSDTVHLLVVHYLWMPSDTGELLYYKFPRQRFEEAVCETLTTHHDFCLMPSLVVDASNNLHIVWQGKNSLCYLEEDANNWYEIDTIYKTKIYTKLYPVIDRYGSIINVVWQDKALPGIYQIFSRMKTDDGWQDMVQVAATAGESKFPTLASAHNCLWQDNSSGIWEIYWSEYIHTNNAWSDPMNISDSPTVSAYPHCAYASVDETAKLYCLWTEGDTIPYKIDIKKIDVMLAPVRYSDLGQQIQSSYCLERDGYWIFGDKPYESCDYDNDSLVYKLTNLDPAKEYRLDLSYYFETNPAKSRENPDNIRPDKTEKKDIISSTRSMQKGIGLSEDIEKGIGRLIQALVIDGVRLDSAFIVPHKLVRVSIWLPNEFYADGEITIEIEKIKGKIVVCGEIILYEFGGEEKCSIANTRGGPQSNEIMHVDPIFFHGLYPNPAKRDLKIKFNSQTERKVTIKLFDVAGRLINQIFSGRLRVGYNEIPIKSTKLAAGIYFIRIETDEETITEKVIILK